MEIQTKKTLSAGGIVINPNNKVIIVNNRGRSWSLPKGHVEAGEDVVAAAKREIYEECGVRNLELIRDLGSYQRYKVGLDGCDDKSELKIIRMFMFRAHYQKLNPIDPENPEARWVSKQEALRILTHPKDQEFFRAWEPAMY